jgi:hypothetical protein
MLMPHFYTHTHTYFIFLCSCLYTCIAAVSRLLYFWGRNFQPRNIHETHFYSFSFFFDRMKQRLDAKSLSWKRKKFYLWTYICKSLSFFGDCYLFAIRLNGEKFSFPESWSHSYSCIRICIVQTDENEWVSEWVREIIFVQTQCANDLRIIISDLTEFEIEKKNCIFNWNHNLFDR